MKTALAFLIVGVLVIGAFIYFSRQPPPIIGTRTPMAPNGNLSNGGAATMVSATEKNRLAWAGWTTGTSAVGLMQAGAVGAGVLLGPGALLACSQLDNPVCNTVGKVYSTAYNTVVPMIPGGSKVSGFADAGGAVVKTGVGRATSFVKSLF